MQQSYVCLCTFRVTLIYFEAYTHTYIPLIHAATKRPLVCPLTLPPHPTRNKCDLPTAVRSLGGTKNNTTKAEKEAEKKARLEKEMQDIELCKAQLQHEVREPPQPAVFENILQHGLTPANQSPHILVTS